MTCIEERFIDILVNDGSIGINLKATENGVGAYIESFYRTPHGYILPAERSQQVQVGDIIYSINDETVRSMKLSSIHDSITHATRPLKLTFIRPAFHLEPINPITNIVRDTKKLPFIDQYLLNNCSKAEASVIANKIMLFNRCDIIIDNFNDASFSSDDLANVLCSFYNSELLQNSISNSANNGNKCNPPPIQPAIICIDHARVHSALMDLRSWLEADLLANFIPNYFRSQAAKRMVACLLDSPPIQIMKLRELLSCNSSVIYFYVFLIQINRSELLLAMLVKLQWDGQCETKFDEIKKRLIRNLIVHDLLSLFYASTVHDCLVRDITSSDGLIADDSTSAGGIHVRQRHWQALLRRCDMPKHVSHHAVSLSMDTANEVIGERKEVGIPHVVAYLIEFGTTAREIDSRNHTDKQNPFKKTSRQHLRKVDYSGIYPARPIDIESETAMRHVFPIYSVLATHRERNEKEQPPQNKLLIKSSSNRAIDLYIDTTSATVGKFSDSNSAFTVEDSMLPFFVPNERFVMTSGPLFRVTEPGSIPPGSRFTNTATKSRSPMYELPKKLFNFILPVTQNQRSQLYGCSLVHYQSLQLSSHVDPVDALLQPPITEQVALINETFDVEIKNQSSIHETPDDKLLIIENACSSQSVPTTSNPTESEVTSLLVSSQPSSDHCSIDSTVIEAITGIGNCPTPVREEDQEEEEVVEVKECGDEQLFTNRMDEASPAALLVKSPLETAIDPPTTAKEPVPIQKPTEKTSPAKPHTGKDFLHDWGKNVLSGLKEVTDLGLSLHSAAVHRIPVPSSAMFLLNVTASASAHEEKVESTSAVTEVQKGKLLGMDSSSMQDITKAMITSVGTGLSSALANLSSGTTTAASMSMESENETPESHSPTYLSESNTPFDPEANALSSTAMDEIIALSSPDPSLPNPSHNCSAMDSYRLSRGSLFSPKSEDAILYVDPNGKPATVSGATGWAIVTNAQAMHALRYALASLSMDAGNEKEDSRVSVLQTLAANYAFENFYDVIESLLENSAAGPTAVLGSEDIDTSVIFENLSSRNIVTIFLACLLEYQILIVSAVSLTPALVLGEWLRNAMQPLSMCHLYLPVLPYTMATELLQCPTPYFIGVLTGVEGCHLTKANLPDKALVVNIDYDSVSIPSSLKSLLHSGRRLVRAIDHRLRPNLYSADGVLLQMNQLHPVQTISPGSSLLQDGRKRRMDTDCVLPLCRQFVAELLLGVRECCVYFQDSSELVVIFDERKFLTGKVRSLTNSPDTGRGGGAQSYLFPPDEGAFVSSLLRSQCFSNYLTALCKEQHCKKVGSNNKKCGD